LDDWRFCAGGALQEAVDFDAGEDDSADKEQEQKQEHQRQHGCGQHGRFLRWRWWRGLGQFNRAGGAFYIAGFYRFAAFRTGVWH
jgi:hypothetical protein